MAAEPLDLQPFDQPAKGTTLDLQPFDEAAALAAQPVTMRQARPSFSGILPSSTPVMRAGKPLPALRTQTRPLLNEAAAQVQDFLTTLPEAALDLGKGVAGSLPFAPAIPEMIAADVAGKVPALSAPRKAAIQQNAAAVEPVLPSDPPEVAAMKSRLAEYKGAEATTPEPSTLESVTGVNPEQIGQLWQQGRYGAALATVVPALALATQMAHGGVRAARERFWPLPPEVAEPRAEVAPPAPAPETPALVQAQPPEAPAPVEAPAAVQPPPVEPLPAAAAKPLDLQPLEVPPEAPPETPTAAERPVGRYYGTADVLKKASELGIETEGRPWAEIQKDIEAKSKPAEPPAPPKPIPQTRAQMEQELREAKAKLAALETPQGAPVALAEGKPVPAEVLADYPELKGKEKPAPSAVPVIKAAGKAEGAKVASRFRSLADTLDKQIENGKRPMTQNPTPKRMKEYRSRLWDAENMERTQRALRALADAHDAGTVPPELVGLRTKDEIGQLVHKGLQSGGGYYDVIPSRDYYKTTPQAKLLQEMIEKRAGETSATKAESARLSKISQLEAETQFAKIPGSFPTPKPLAERLVNMADIRSGMKVLEPSAGKGNIADAIQAKGVSPDTIEIQSRLAEILKLKNYNVVGSDFLEHKAGGYDRIVMNPPFEKGADVEHVQHAYDLLKSGGRLVAVMGEHSFFGGDKKATAFRDWLEERGGSSEKIEKGFTGAEAERQTGVASRVVVIDKPAAKAAAVAAENIVSPGALAGATELGRKAGQARRNHDEASARIYLEQQSRRVTVAAPEYRKALTDAFNKAYTEEAQAGMPAAPPPSPTYEEWTAGGRKPLPTGKAPAETKPAKPRKKVSPATEKALESAGISLPPLEETATAAGAKRMVVPPAMQVALKKGRNFEGEYLKAALEPAKAAWDKTKEKYADHTISWHKDTESARRQGVPVNMHDPEGNWVAGLEVRKVGDTFEVIARGNAEGPKRTGQDNVYQIVDRAGDWATAKKMAEGRLRSGQVYNPEASWQYENIYNNQEVPSSKVTPRSQIKPQTTKPADFPEAKLLVKVPDDGTFVIPNNPAAVDRALKAADKFVPEKTPSGKLRVASAPEEFNAEKYIVGLEKEIADLEDQVKAARKGGLMTVPYYEEQLRAAQENLAEAKKATAAPAKARASEAGFATPAALIEAPLAAAKLAKGAVLTVKDAITNEAERVRESRQLHEGIYDLESQVQGDKVRVLQALKKTEGSAQDWQAIYHWQEDPSYPISDRQKQLFQDELKPYVDENQRIYTKLTDGGMPVENYVHRVVRGKGGLLERLLTAGQEKRPGGGAGNVLSKYAAATKGRSIMALEDAEGNRRVVSVKGGRVTAFGGEKPEDLGAFRSGFDTKGGLLEEQVAPLERQITKLERERSILTQTKGRIATTFGRRKNITEKIDALERQRDRILASVPPSQLRDRMWVDKQGNEWRFRQATTREIEANTNLRYYHNALGSALSSYMELRRAERAFDFLEGFKSSPQFGQVAHALSEGPAPSKWRRVNLDQFRGYAFRPHEAEVLNWFADRLHSDPPGIYQKIGNFLRTAIFFNPLIHIPNISVHWGVEKGIRGWLPDRWLASHRAGMKAINAVIHQNADYLAALDVGAPLQSARLETRSIPQLFFEKMAKDLDGNPTTAKRVADALGYASPAKLVRSIYRFSSNATWLTNDIAFLQGTYEKTGRGMDLKEALNETGKHIPTYRIPSRIFDSHSTAKLMANPNLSMFGAYHYGALKSYGQMVKSVLAGKSAAERAHGLDLLATVGLVTFVLYPQVDKVLKALTGDKDVELRRAGAATFPYNFYRMVKGEMSPTEFAQAVVTPAVQAKAAVEMGFNRDLRTGRRIYNPHAPAGELGWQLATKGGEFVAPISAIERGSEDIAQGKKTALGMIGVRYAKHGAEKIAQDIASTKMGQEAPTPETFGKTVTMRPLRQAAEKGDLQMAREANRNRQITPQQYKTLVRTARGFGLVDRVKNFDYEELQQVYQAATPEQRQQLEPLLRRKERQAAFKHRNQGGPPSTLPPFLRFLTGRSASSTP